MSLVVFPHRETAPVSPSRLQKMRPVAAADPIGGLLDQESCFISGVNAQKALAAYAFADYRAGMIDFAELQRICTEADAAQ